MRLLLLAILLLTSTVQSTTYYVKPTGDDGANGTSIGTAWEHTQYACQQVAAGDTVFIRGGYWKTGTAYTGDSTGQSPDSIFKYHEIPYADNSIQGSYNRVGVGLRPIVSGTSGNQIVFKGFSGEELPIIEGAIGNAWDDEFDVSDGPEDSLISVAQLTGRNYVTYDSLYFNKGYTGFFTTASHHLIIKNCIIDSVSGGMDNLGAFMTVGAPLRSSVRDILIDNCDISKVWHYGQPTNVQVAGVELYGCSSVVISNSVFHNMLRGVYWKGGGTHAVIRDCIFRDLDMGLVASNGGQQDSSTIHHNVFYDIADIMLAINEGTNAESLPASYALEIYNNTFNSRDGVVAIYAKNGDIENVEIFNNIFYRIRPAQTNSAWTGAISFKNAEYTTHRGFPIDTYIDYNLYDTSGGEKILMYDLNGASPYNTHTLPEWRIVWADSTFANDVNSFVGDPEFTNAGANDYTIDTTSLAATGGRGGDYPTYLGAFDPSPSTGVVGISGNVNISGNVIIQ